MADISTAIVNLVNRLRALETLPQPAPSYYNLCVNGGMEVWTAGAGPFTANGNQIADTWYIELGGGSTVSVTKDTTNFDAYYSATCAKVVYTHSTESGLKHTVHGPFNGSAVAASVRVKTTMGRAVRLKVGSVYGAYHSGSGNYETLTLPVRPVTNNFDVEIVFDADCTAYIDNVMCVQGMGPIDYIALTTEDNARRITDY